jgi:hypothetical protein
MAITVGTYTDTDTALSDVAIKHTLWIPLVIYKVRILYTHLRLPEEKLIFLMISFMLNFVDVQGIFMNQHGCRSSHI